MNLRQAPNFFDPTSNTVFLPDDGVMSLSVNHITKIMLEADIPFPEECQQELLTLLQENPQCKQFVIFTEKLQEVEKNSSSGMGLSFSEKNHYNALLDEMSLFRTDSSDNIEKMKFKVNEIRIRQSQLLKYTNIIKLNQTYFNLLSQPEVWAPKCSQIKLIWDSYKRFARQDSRELLDLYKTYTKALSTVKRFVELIPELSKKISLKSKSALLKYVNYLIRQIEEARIQAIMSMLYRMQLAEEYQDIYFDDLIYQTIYQIEKVLQYRVIIEQKDKQLIFDQLRKRQRRGLTFEIIREFILNIKNYLIEYSNVDHNSIKHSEITSQLNKLSFVAILNPENNIFVVDIEHDPIIYYTVNHFINLIKVVKNCFLSDTEKAFSIIANLDALYNDATKYIKNIHQRDWFYEGKKIEEKLKELRKEYLDLLQYVYYFLIDKVNIAGDELTKDISKENLKEMSVYQNSKDWLKKFEDRYGPLLVKTIELKKQDLLIKTVLTVNQDPGIIDSSEKRHYFATILAQNYYWPIDKEKSREYESTLKYIEYRLESLSKYFSKATFYIDIYSNHNWMLYFLEQAFPQEDDDKVIRHKVLCKFCVHPWENVFELCEVELDDHEIMIVPKQVLGECSDIKIRDIRSTRQKVIFENSSLFKKVNDSASHFESVVLPYIRVSPFVSLFNINHTQRYFEDFNHLLSLYDQLINNLNIESEMIGWTSTYKSQDFLIKLKCHCEDSKNKMIMAWSKALFESIDASTTVKDICFYLHDSEKLINHRKLLGLIDKIKHLFGSQVYRDFLLCKVQDACADIIIKNVISELSRLGGNSKLQNFIYCITQLAQTGNFGKGVLERIIKDQQVTVLIEEHLKSFDGTRDEIGGLIVALHPLDTTPEDWFINHYIMPYAVKRLHYIQQRRGQCIHYGDIIFFDKFASVPSFKDLFSQYQSQFHAEFFDHLTSPSQKWDANVAKLIELFGDYQGRCAYRARCIIPLLEQDYPAQNDHLVLNLFESSLFHHNEKLIDPKFILPNNKPWDIYVDHYINATVWNELRDRVLGLLDYQQQQRAHMWFLYQFLNNHVSDFGPWLETQLVYLTPEELFGEEGVEYISQHVIGLIKVAHSASHEMSIDESQFEMISTLVPNLKYMRMFFKKLNNHVAYMILDDIEMLENNLRLTGLSRKLLRLLSIHEGNATYDDKGVYNVLNQLIELFNEIERSALINFDNIKAYLCFIDNIITRLSFADFNTMPEMYLVGYFNFYLNVIEHFKKIIMQFVKQSYVPDQDAKFIGSLINCFDDNKKIEQRRYLVSIALEYNSSLRDIVDYFLDLSYRVNQIAKNSSDLFLFGLMKQVHVGSVKDDPLSFSLICMRNILTYSKSLRLSSGFLFFMIKQINEALDCLPLPKMGEFTRHFSPHISELRQIASNAIQANCKVVTRQTIFQPNQQLYDQRITGLMLNTYYQKNMCFNACLKLIGYIDSKSTIKAVKKYSFIKEIMFYIHDRTEIQQLDYIESKLGLKIRLDAKKVLFALELLNIVELIYLGRLNKFDLLDKVVFIQNLIKGKEQFNDFMPILKFLGVLMKTCDSAASLATRDEVEVKPALK